jgi:hypothetical protein
MVKELAHVDDNMKQRKKLFSFMGWFDGVWPITATEARKNGEDSLEPVCIQFSRTALFQGLTRRRCASNVDSNCC